MQRVVSTLSLQKVFRKFSMIRNPQQRRSPEQIRAGNKRLGFIMFVIAAVFFVGIFVKQCWFT